MNPSSIAQSSTTSIQPTLRKSKSLSSLRNKPRRITGIIKRVFSVLTKLKSLSNIALSEDNEAEDIFGSSDSDFFPRKQSRGSKQIEQEFLSDYHTYKSLDGISNHYRNLDAKNMGSSEDLGKISFKDLDVSKLRVKMQSSESMTAIISNSPAENSEEREGTKENLGEVLWNYRRSVWLENRSDENGAESKESNRKAIVDLPKTLYPRIYSNLIEKSKPLKDGKRINLQDLLQIIDDGWVQEQRWERAAKGLA